MAAELEKVSDVEITKTSGGLGELSVVIDGEKVFDSNRLWYPRTKNIVNSVKDHLAKSAS